MFTLFTKMKKELTKEELKDFIEVVLKDFKNHPFPDLEEVLFYPDNDE